MRYRPTHLHQEGIRELKLRKRRPGLVKAFIGKGKHNASEEALRDICWYNCRVREGSLKDCEIGAVQGAEVQIKEACKGGEGGAI